MRKTKESKPKLLDDEGAKRAAKRSIEENKMAEWPQCILLKNPKLVMQPPFKVQEKADEDGRHSEFTYVVPFGIQGDNNENGVPFTRLCILVDGKTGEFEEVTVFGKPVAYIDKAKAVQVVAEALNLPPELIIVTEAKLIYEPGEITNVRAYPFWKIVVKEREYFVDQAGKMYEQVSPSKGGS